MFCSSGTNNSVNLRRTGFWACLVKPECWSCLVLSCLSDVRQFHLRGTDQSVWCTRPFSCEFWQRLIDCYLQSFNINSFCFVVVLFCCLSLFAKHIFEGIYSNNIHSFITRHINQSLIQTSLYNSHWWIHIMHELHSFILFWILLAISPARLIPDPTSRLRKLDIGFWLPRKRSRRGSNNLKKGQPVELVTPCVLQSGFQTDLKRPSSVNSTTWSRSLYKPSPLLPTILPSLCSTPVLSTVPRKEQKWTPSSPTTTYN